MTERGIDVRVAKDPERFRATDQLVWFQEEIGETAEEHLRGVPEDQRFAAELPGTDSGTYAGVYGVYPMTLAAPGPGSSLVQLPCAGLTWVGVHPDHRRKGVLTAMLRHHFEQVHEQPGTFVSALHASEPAIYGRHGYGLASLELEVTLGSRTTLTAPYLEDAAAGVTTQVGRLSEPDMARRLRECHLAHAGLGAVVGGLDYYARVCHQPPEHLRDKEPARVLFARRDGVDVGFAVFRRTHKWERARPSGELTVWALVGEPAAQLVLLRRLVDFDLIGRVKVGTVGPEDPLLHWIGGYRAASDVATYDSLWVRLVDLPEALQARSWSAGCDVVLRVADVAAPWNDGTWRIEAGSGEATVERSRAEPDLSLSTQALGAAYLGGGSLVALQQAGIVEEHRAGAVAELGRAMRTDVPPTAAVGF